MGNCGTPQIPTTESAVTDCRSEEGITVGLMDTIIVACRLLVKRDLTSSEAVRQALIDLDADEDLTTVLLAAGKAAFSQKF